jgi:serine/threonine protein kinase
MYHRSQPTLYDPSVASVTSNQSKINQYQVYQKLGEGSYGQVRLAKNTQSNKYYALKMVLMKITVD